MTFEMVKTLFAFGGVVATAYSLYRVGQVFLQDRGDDAPIRVKGGSPVTVKHRDYPWQNAGNRYEDTGPTQWDVAIWVKAVKQSVTNPARRVEVTVMDAGGARSTVECQPNGRGLAKVHPRDSYSSSAAGKRLTHHDANSYVALVDVDGTMYPPTGTYTKADDVDVVITPVA